jgi:hypothetical protein
MSHIVASDVTGTEAVKLIEQGKELLCPVCATTIATVPENWIPGMPLHGIQCPIDQQHYMIHFEDEAAMKAMRTRMRARALKK